MMDINNIDSNLIIKLVNEIDKDSNYIINNYLIDDRINLFINLLNSELMYEEEYEDKIYKLCLYILTYDEMDLLKTKDNFKAALDAEDIESFKILLGTPDMIASSILSEQRVVSLYIIMLLPQEKKNEVLNIIKDSIYNVLSDKSKKDELDKILNINSEEEFYSIIRNLGSQNIINIMNNYPNLVPIYNVLDILDDDQKEQLLDENNVHKRGIIESIEDKNKKYDLAQKYLNIYDFVYLIQNEKDESFKLNIAFKYYDKFTEFDLQGILERFNSSENIYNFLDFFHKKGKKFSGYQLINVCEKLDDEYLIKIIDMLNDNFKSYEIFELIQKLDPKKKYEYILKYRNRLENEKNKILKNLMEDFELEEIEENKFINLIIEFFKNEYIGYEFSYLMNLISNESKLKLIDELKFSRDFIVDIVDEMGLSSKEKLDLGKNYNIYDVQETNKLIAELPINLRLEYLEEYLKTSKYYYIDEESLNAILKDTDLVTKVDIMDLLTVYSKIDFEIISKLDLNFESLSDDKILELFSRVKTTSIKAIILTYLKDDTTKYNLYKEMNILGYSIIENMALSSFKDKEIKFKFLIFLSNYHSNIQYTISKLNNIDLDISFFENFINNNRNSREYAIMINAIMISKFDDKLKIKYFSELNYTNNPKNFKLLLESLKFDDENLDYNVFKEVIKDLFYKKQFNMFDNIDNKVLEFYFNDTELYFLEARKTFNGEDKSILDNFIDINDLKREKIEYVINIINKINNSNCLEVIRIGSELKPLLISEENSFDKLNSLEKIFLRNNLPFGVKLYEVFEVLHPNFQNFSGTIYSKVLNDEEISMSKKYAVLLEDMIKISFLSAPKQGIDYLNEMQHQIDLLKKVLYIKNKNVKYEDLNEESKIVVNKILNIVNSWSFIFKFQKESDLGVIYDYINEDMIDGIENWIVNTISNSLGLDLNKISDIRDYLINNANMINERNKNYNDFTLKEGDLIKGVGSYEKFLFGMLQNGINCKEFLGSNAGGDMTNLDTDFSMISTDKGSIRDSMEDTTASGFGSLWIVIKNREDRFNKEGSLLDKRMELFKINGDSGDNYGIRSGVPVTEIDYIICNNWDERIGFSIACSGIYIPVVNKESELLFSFSDFEKMRNKMQGLSYYDSSEYKLSDTIYKGDTNTIEYLKKDAEETNRKREIIYDEIDSTINLLGYNVLHTLDDDFTTNNMELIDTGSTSRGNNKPNDADFDFMFRMDSDLYKDERKKSKFVNCIEEKLKELGGTPNVGNNPPKRLRYTDVHFDGMDEGIEIDISFIQRTNKVNYTTDMCLIDRMNNIKEQYPNLYDSVRLNVIIAKSILKKAGIYKRVENCLGGVGTENWILQNGGSVIDAINSFLDVANNCSTLEEFKLKYSIFDFGSNFYESSINDGHDNFICNLSEENYQKMKNELNKFKNEYDQACTNGKLDEYISSVVGFNPVNLSNVKSI